MSFLDFGDYDLDDGDLLTLNIYLVNDSKKFSIVKLSLEDTAAPYCQILGFKTIKPNSKQACRLQINMSKMADGQTDSPKLGMDYKEARRLGQ